MRPKSLAVLIVIATLVALGLVAWCVSVQTIDSESWGIPNTLPTTFDHLTVLELPREVTRLGWLKRSQIRELNISHSRVTSFWDLPSRLRVLRARNLRISRLRWLPDLEELDVRQCDIAELSGLPSSIKRLAIGGSALDRASLPQGLLQLAVEDVDPTLLSLYPSRITGLRVVGSPQPSWRTRLPETLTRLSVDAMSLEQLPDLPTSLILLEVRAHERLAVERLPPYLKWFSTAGVGWSEIGTLLSLEELRVRGPSLPEGLPTTLHSLTLTFTGVVEPRETLNIPDLPNLRSLVIQNYHGKIDALPDRLEALDLTASPWVGLEGLPHTLKTLILADWPVVDFAALPQNIESLDISGVGQILNPSVQLRKLTALIYRGARSPLPRLPESLTVLDVSESRELTALPRYLPPGLTELRLRDTGLTKLPRKENLERLKKLDVCQSSIERITELPSGLVELRVHTHQLAERVKLPAKLTRMAIRSPVDCTAEEEMLWWTEAPENAAL